MLDVTHDGDLEPVELPEPLADRQTVEERLRRVLVGSVAAVDDRDVEPFGEPPRRSCRRA
jgi:hypothetical protein